MHQISKRLQSFNEEEVVASSSRVERRQHPRYPVESPIDLWLWQTPNVIQGGVLTDMSEMGLGFHSIHEFQISAELGIRVYLSRGEFQF
jgi:hypothetical protein